MKDELKVITERGQFIGHTYQNVYRFLSIPYANPLSHENRFKRSSLHDKTNETIDCSEIKGNCYQFGPNFDGDDTPKQTYDCLYLNVYTSGTEKKKPVFVWIHGGGFMTGCMNYPMYDGKNFAEKDIVFVSINYRLGAYGYCDLSSLGEEFDSNNGLSDQINALKWIHENIDKFGGDPNDVTICGESAGGMSMYALSASPLTEGFFQKCIIQSGLAYNSLTKEQSKWYKDAFLSLLGLNDKEGKKLLETPDEVIVEKYSHIDEEIAKRHIGAMTNCLVMDDLLPYDTMEAAERGIHKDVRFFIGTNKDEGTLFCNPLFNPGLYSWERQEIMYQENGALEIFKKLKDYYLNHGENGDDPLQRIVTDNMFLRGNVDFADIRKEYTDVYFYRFDFSTPKSRAMGMKSCHAMEMTFALGTTVEEMLNRPNMFEGADPEEVKNIQNQMHEAWVNFVKTGTPGKDFPKYDGNRYVHVFNLTPGIISYKDYEPIRIFNGVRINTK